MKREVKVHSCRAETEIRDAANLNPERRYYSDDPQFKFFKAIPAKCKCKKTVSLQEAEAFVKKGRAFRVYKPKKFRPLNDSRVDPFQVVMPIDRTQTPRVDLITKADIERAYVECDSESNKYVRYIEDIHEMILLERAKLIVAFRPDPQEGRLLFPFGPDQRTHGGHA